MGKALEDVLRKELGFGDKRIEKFMSAYMAEVAVTAEMVEPDVFTSGNPPLSKISYHAKARYVERVYGLEFSEEHMRAYVKDHSDKIGNEMRDLYNRSKFLLDREFTPKGKDKQPVMRGFYIVENIVFIVESSSQTVITTWTIAFNLPKSLEMAMIETVTDQVIQSRITLEQAIKNNAYLQQQQEERLQGLLREREALDKTIAQCKQDIKEANTPIELHKRELFEKADYLVNNKNYSEDDLL